MVIQLSLVARLAPHLPNLPSLSITTYFDRTNRTFSTGLYPNQEESAFLKASLMV
jgi:hypothetical protein